MSPPVVRVNSTIKVANSPYAWEVHKFGGTSVKDAVCIQRVALILTDLSLLNKHDPDMNSPRSNTKIAVVLSAMSGITDSLIHTATLASKRDDRYLKSMADIRKRHEIVCDTMFPENSCDEGTLSARRHLHEFFDEIFNDFSALMRAVWVKRHVSFSMMEVVSGIGELLSTALLTQQLKANHHREAVRLDARDVLVVVSSEQKITGTENVEVKWQESAEKFSPWLASNVSDKTEYLIITGFVAMDSAGVTRTLGRNGGDYSGTIFSSLLGAKWTCIWTDVDGVFSADPRIVPDAFRLPHISYNEAMELAYFGASILHPATMHPSVRSRIPLWIRNTLNASCVGTLICDPETRIAIGGIWAPTKDFSSPVTALSTVKDTALINIEGSGLKGVAGVAQRLFGALKEARISVIMISQASSEHSITFAVKEDEAERAHIAASSAFEFEIHLGKVEVDCVRRRCALAVVGDNMNHHVGVASRVTAAIAEAGVNIVAIAQGCSERNISVVIDTADREIAMRSVHAKFFSGGQQRGIVSETPMRAVASPTPPPSPPKLYLGVIGNPSDTLSLCKFIAKRTLKFLSSTGIDVCVVGIAEMNGTMILATSTEHAISILNEPIPNSELIQSCDWEVFTSHLRRHTALSSCEAALSIVHVSKDSLNPSSSDLMNYNYHHWLRSGINVVSSCLSTLSASADNFLSWRKHNSSRRVYCLSDASLGLSLPSVIRQLQNSCDSIDTIKVVSQKLNDLSWLQRIVIISWLSGVFNVTYNSLASMSQANSPLTAVIDVHNAKCTMEVTTLKSEHFPVELVVANGNVMKLSLECSYDEGNVWLEIVRLCSLLFGVE